MMDFSKGRPHEKDTHDTQTHTNHGSSTHDVRPKGGLPLRYKVLLVALLYSLFVASFCNAIRLVIADEPETAVPYLLIGVSGILASVIVGFSLVAG